MFKFTALFSLAALAASVAAQQGEWAQCGGINWTGGTTCQSPYVCTELNPYYYQCLPGSSSSSSTHSTTTTSSTHSTTTTSSTHSTTTTSSTHTTTTTSHSSSSSSTSTGGTTGPTQPAGNPFSNCNIFLSPPYTAEVQAAAAQISDTNTKNQALNVAKIPTFIWFDTVEKVPNLDDYLSAAEAAGGCQVVQIVIYDLPNRDCAAHASNGEFQISDNGVANYKNYIDQIVAIIKKYPTVRVVAVIEPDSLANLVTNLSVANCANAQAAYLECVNYALIQLSSVGVYSYMDAGHAGWLGWPANLQPAAQLFASVWKNASSSPFIRGLATDVSNYNALQTNSPDPVTQGDPNYDELLYIEALAPQLQQQGWSGAQFIIDQGRSGVQNIRNQWGDWCNIKGAGFGLRPTSTGLPSSLIDSIVWVKPGGECDGTSNSSSPRFDSTCALSDALQPSPEAGTWFQTYFLDLIANANPPISTTA